MDETKHYVALLNEEENVFAEIGISIFDIFDPYKLIPIGSVTQNNALMYALDNLIVLTPFADKVRFELNINLLIARNDRFGVDKEIARLTEKMQSIELPTYEYIGLIKLANVVQDYELLNRIRNKLMEVD